MRSLKEIRELLEQLDQKQADDLEDQDLDFKEWCAGSLRDAASLVVEMAVCMANGGGGTVVFGVRDKVIGRAAALLGVPPEVDPNRLKKAVYDATDPKLTPVFEELAVPDGTQRLLVMQVHGGLPPYTDTAGKGKVRVGKDCQPLTGTMRRRILVETGENDFTAEEVPEPVEAILSPAALEALRDVACQEKAPPDLLAAGDLDILGALGVLRGGRLNRAGLLLAGRSLAIERHVPNHLWTHLRMQSETDYQDRADGRDALPIALTRMTDRIMANNPITTLAYGLFHFEYRTYPELALREALLNALCHRDFRLGGPVIVKQLPGRLEIGNPGGFIGGITPENILHHLPVARNPALVDALTQLRLVNRSNLGIQRMFSAMLIEGKAPPRVEEQGDAVVIVLRAAPLSAPLRAFVAEENGRGRLLSVDHLLVLRHLLGHPELSTPEAARLCQRAEPEARELLGQMEREFGYLERGGTGRGTYWRLNHSLHHRLAGPGQPERDQRIEWETAKTRLLDILRQRSERGGPGLSNEEARAATLLDRRQIKRLLSELRDEGHVRLVGRGRYARWVFAAPGQ